MLELLYNEDTIYEAEMRSISFHESYQEFDIDYDFGFDLDEIEKILQQEHEDDVNRYLNHDIPFECHVENYYSYWYYHPYRVVSFHFLPHWTDGPVTRTHLLEPYRVLCLFLLFVCTSVSELSLAYAEYLERMFENSDDLVVVDLFTVPPDVDLDNPVLYEWTDVD